MNLDPIDFQREETVTTSSSDATAPTSVMDPNISASRQEHKSDEKLFAILPPWMTTGEWWHQNTSTLSVSSAW